MIVELEKQEWEVIKRKDWNALRKALGMQRVGVSLWQSPVSPVQSSRVFELPVARPLHIALSQCPRQRFALRFLRIIEEYLCGLDPADL